MRTFMLLIFVGLSATKTKGQELKPSTIADSLRKDAVAVKRVDETVLEIESPRKAKLHYHRVYTILNSSGDQYATVTTFYDKFHRLNTATATMYDANGKELKKIKKSDMEDWIAEGAGTVMSDTRVKIYKFVNHNYPYTISYEEETDLEGIFILPQWRPQTSPTLAVENSRLVVTAPAQYALRYRQYHYNGEVAITEKNGNKTYTWEARNRPAYRPEPLSSSLLHLETCVKLAPGDFEIQGYKGSMYTWTDMGNFINTLWQGRDQLPEEAKKKVHALVDGLKDEKEKINVLYDFLQKNSRYVNIQLGIGGWQPFDAASVYNNRYGDCKALSNYMVALLKEAGIAANSVLIKAGSTDPDIDTSFACSQFNHCIVLARTGGDSIWLECTSQTLPPGYLSSFTDDRDALLIEKMGGTIVHTPVYGLAENRLDRTVRGSIDSNGNFKATMQIRYTGLEQDYLHGLINHYTTKKELSTQRQQDLGLSNFVINDLSYQQTRGKIPVIEETMQLSAENYATHTGSRLFISPGLFLKRVIRLPDPREPRKNDIELMTSFQETDSLILQIPPDYIPERALESRRYTSSFGGYNFHSELNNNILTIICHFQQVKGHYPAASFSRLVQFFNLIYRESTNELILVKKQ